MRSGVKSTSPCNGIRLWLALSLAALVWSVPCEAEDQTGFWHPLKAAFHVHSQLSTGSDSLDALAARPKMRGSRRSSSPTTTCSGMSMDCTRFVD